MASCSEAAKRRWADPIFRAKRRQRGAPKRLQKDLRILAWVIRGIRGRLELPEKNRRSSLAAWHKKAIQKNAERRKPLDDHYRMAVSRQAKRRSADLAALEKAIRRVDSRNTAKLRRVIRRRYEKIVTRVKVTGSKSAAAQRLLGCSLLDLRAHLERQFKPGMTWENYGFHGWHIDHIKPLAAFKFPEQIREAFHYTNLQPLWMKENLEKADNFSVQMAPETALFV